MAGACSHIPYAITRMSRLAAEPASATATPKVAFVLFQNIAAGSGTEIAVQNYVKFASQEMRRALYIIQADSLDVARTSSLEVESILPPNHVLTIRGIPSSAKVQFFGSLRVASLLFYGILWPAWWMLSGAGRKYRKLIERVRPQVVYLVGNDLARFCKFPWNRTIGSTHGWNPRSARGRFEKLQLKLLKDGLIARTIDGFHIFPGSEVAHNLPKGKRVFEVPNGVDTDTYFPSQKSNRRARKFLFVGRLVSCKGVATLLQAWEGTPHEQAGATLDIVGGGPLSTWVSAQSSKSVRYRGVLRPRALAEEYRSCDVLLFPSRCDRYPFVVLEALASGLVVVASDMLRGTFDDFEDCGALRYCPPSPEAFRGAITSLILDDADLSRAREEGVDLARRSYETRLVSRQMFRGLLSQVDSVHP